MTWHGHWRRTLIHTVAACLAMTLAGSAWAQKESANVTRDEDGAIRLTSIPDALSAKDMDPQLARLGEWLAKYYGKEVPEARLNALGLAIDNTFTTVRGYEKAYDIFKGESKLFGIMINDIYSLNSSRYDKIVRSYNRQAKSEGLPPAQLDGSTTWWTGGIRMELRSANMQTLINSMDKGTLRNKIPVYVKRELESGNPLAWARIFGIGTTTGYYGVRACVIVGFDPVKEELQYIDLGGKIGERLTVSYDEAAATTWAIYRISPRSK